jgi:hypothetical protein
MAAITAKATRQLADGIGAHRLDSRQSCEGSCLVLLAASQSEWGVIIG